MKTLLALVIPFAAVLGVLGALETSAGIALLVLGVGAVAFWRLVLA